MPWVGAGQQGGQETGGQRLSTGGKRERRRWRLRRRVHRGRGNHRGEETMRPRKPSKCDSWEPRKEAASRKWTWSVFLKLPTMKTAT